MTKDPNEPLTALFDLPPYGVEAEEKRVLLQAAMAAELAHHLEHNAEFKRLCGRRGIDSADPNRPLAEYPLLPAITFKRHGPQLLSVPPEDVRFTLTSSATSGAPSEVVVDAITAKRQTRALGRVVSALLGPQRRPYIFVDLNPELAPQLIGARRAAVLGYMRQASSSDFVLRAGDDGRRLLLDEDCLDAARRAAAEAGVPPVLFGFTYVLFDLLVRPYHGAGRKLELPPGSAILHIGGWKKLAAEKVDKVTFNAMAAEVFGVAPERIFDVYGFTEQMGMNYPECSAGGKHVPAFGEVFVRDPVTLELLPSGQEGLLHFVSPLPHSYPGISVVTDDLGMIVAHDDCACGRLGTSFQVTGRAALAEARGCGDILADKFLNPGRPYVSKDASWQVLLHGGAEPSQPLSPDTVIADLRLAHDWLKRVPLEGLIALLAQASQRWLEAPALVPFRKQGLDFLAQWCTARQLRRMLDFAFRGNRGALDAPVPSPVNSRAQLLLVPRGVAVHWVAGNVPLIGWFVLAQTILTRNLNIVKVPHALRHLLPAMVQELGRCEVRLPQGIVRGRDLVQTISVVYHDHGHPAAETLSRAADVRVAWGGREAMEALAGLPSRYDCQDVFFGPKLSYMCIGREAVATERSYRRLLRHAAVDCSVFDQYACASPHTIFVEAGGRITAEAFAADLAGEMANAAERIPPSGWDAGTAQAIHLRRIEYEMRHQVWHSRDLSWTVLYDQEEGLAEPCYARVVTVRSVDDIQRAAALAHPDVQSIGLALSGERRLAFAEVAAAHGVCRLPDVGKMTHFEWIWDGLLPLDRLVRWVTLGGP
jgi:hypothetical protein